MMTYDDDLACPGAHDAHIKPKGNWLHLQKEGGPTKIHLETAISPDQGDGPGDGVNQVLLHGADTAKSLDH